MCTVVARQLADGWVVTMNRDEQRTRSEGEPPTLWQDPEFLAPRDPDAGGTWIGVRADGTWACLLNGYIEGKDTGGPANPATRGRLIPLVLNADDPEAAIANEDLINTRSFRLWIGDERGILDCFWDGETLTQNRLAKAAWQFTTSSSLQQSRAQKIRSDVHAQWVAEGASHLGNGLPSLMVDRRGIDAEYAIRMEREVSHTKSCTQIITSRQSITMQHWSASELAGEPSRVIELQRTAAEAA